MPMRTITPYSEQFIKHWLTQYEGHEQIPQKKWRWILEWLVPEDETPRKNLPVDDEQLFEALQKNNEVYVFVKGERLCTCSTCSNIVTGSHEFTIENIQAHWKPEY